MLHATEEVARSNTRQQSEMFGLHRVHGIQRRMPQGRLNDMAVKCWVGRKTERNCENRGTIKCILCKWNVIDYDPNHNRGLSNIQECRYCRRPIWFRRNKHWHDKCVKLYEYREHQDSMLREDIQMSHPDYPCIMHGIVRLEIIGYDTERLQVRHLTDDKPFWIPQRKED